MVKDVNWIIVVITLQPNQKWAEYLIDISPEQTYMAKRHTENAQHR